MNPKVKEMIIQLLGTKEIMKREGKPHICLLRMDVLIASTEIQHVSGKIEDLDEEQCKKLIELFDSIKHIVAPKPQNAEGTK